MLYSESYHRSDIEYSKDELRHILKLSYFWLIPEARRFAIHRLDAVLAKDTVEGLAERLSLASTYKIGVWLPDAFYGLAGGSGWFGPEVEYLDVYWIAEISRVRGEWQAARRRFVTAPQPAVDFPTCINGTPCRLLWFNIWDRVVGHLMGVDTVLRADEISAVMTSQYTLAQEAGLLLPCQSCYTTVIELMADPESNILGAEENAIHCAIDCQFIYDPGLRDLPVLISVDRI